MGSAGKGVTGVHSAGEVYVIYDYLAVCLLSVANTGLFVQKWEKIGFVVSWVRVRVRVKVSGKIRISY